MKSVPSRCPGCHEQGVPIGMKSYTNDVFFWQCHHCDLRWHHHPEGTRLHEQADPYVQRGINRWLKGKDIEL
jgi:hypothetical protein